MIAATLVRVFVDLKYSRSSHRVLTLVSRDKKKFGLWNLSTAKNAFAVFLNKRESVAFAEF